MVPNMQQAEVKMVHMNQYERERPDSLIDIGVCERPRELEEDYKRSPKVIFE